MPTIQKTTSSSPPVLNADELVETKNALPVLTAKQDEMVNAVLEYFMQECYVLPGAAKDEGTLKDEEKYWLVSTHHDLSSATLMLRMSTSLMTAFSGEN